MHTCCKTRPHILAIHRKPRLEFECDKKTATLTFTPPRPEVHRTTIIFSVKEIYPLKNWTIFVREEETLFCQLPFHELDLSTVLNQTDFQSGDRRVGKFLCLSRRERRSQKLFTCCQTAGLRTVRGSVNEQWTPWPEDSVLWPQDISHRHCPLGRYQVDLTPPFSLGPWRDGRSGGLWFLDGLLRPIGKYSRRRTQVQSDKRRLLFYCLWEWQNKEKISLNFNIFVFAITTK